MLAMGRWCCQLLRQLSDLQQNGLPGQIPDRLFANRHLFCKRKSRLMLNDTGYLWRERRYSILVDDNRAVDGNFRQDYVGNRWVGPNFHHYGRCRIGNAISLNIY